MSTAEATIAAVRPPPSLPVTGGQRSWGYWTGIPWLLVPVVAWSWLVASVRGDARAKANARVLLRHMFRGADFFCSIIWLLRGFYSISDPYRPARYFPVRQGALRTVPRTIDLDGLVLHYGVDDIDAPERRMSGVYRFLYLMLRRGPAMKPIHRELPSIHEYRRMLAEDFGPTFVTYRPLDVDPNAPSTPARYCTHDYGAPFLTREGNRFVVDMSHWEPLSLKYDGAFHEAYGGRLEFDADCTDVSITWKGTRYDPSHPDWPKVRFIHTSTVLIAVVLEVHTLQIHYLNASLFGLYTREFLPEEHPMYRFLRPFTLRTVMINEHAIHSILTESGIIHHGTPLTWESIKRLYHRAASTYRHVPVPEQLRRAGLLEPDGKAAPGVAFAEEGLEVWPIVARFVEEYVALYYADDAAVVADRPLLAWYREIRSRMPSTADLPDKLTRAALVDFLAVFVWNVTFWHDFTSQTGNSLADYRLGSVLIKRPDVFGTFYPNVQESFVTLLAHQLTTVEGNKVVDNFHHFWLDDDAVEVAVRFQAALWKYRAEMNKRNATRELAFNAYDPAVIETSVQT